MKVTKIETLHCDAGWRNYHFVKLTTEDGIVGWSEFDEGFGSPGVTAVIERLAERVVGQQVSNHERIYAELFCLTRPAAGGVVGEGTAGDRHRGVGEFALKQYAAALDQPVHGCSPKFAVRPTDNRAVQVSRLGCLGALA